MKKANGIFCIAGTIILTIVLLFAGCSSEDELYEVIVTNGTGSGRFPAGIQIRISAGQAPSDDLAFKTWVSNVDVVFNDPNVSRTRFTMPAQDVTVTANYDTAFTVTVNGGSGSGRYASGATVPIAANVVHNHFLRWETDDSIEFTDAGRESTTFTMPASDVTVQAVMLYQFFRMWGWIPNFWMSGTGINYETEYGWDAQKGFLVDDDGLLAIGPRGNELWQFLTTKENLVFNIDTLRENSFVIKNLDTGRFLNVKGITPVAGTDAVNGYQVKVSDFEDDPAFYWGMNPALVNDIDTPGTIIINANIFNGTADDGGMLSIIGDPSNKTIKPSGNDTRLIAVQFLHARGGSLDTTWRNMFNRTQVFLDGSQTTFPNFSTIYSFGIW